MEIDSYLHSDFSKVDLDCDIDEFMKEHHSKLVDGSCNSPSVSAGFKKFVRVVFRYLKCFSAAEKMWIQSTYAREQYKYYHFRVHSGRRFKENISILWEKCTGARRKIERMLNEINESEKIDASLMSQSQRSLNTHKASLRLKLSHDLLLILNHFKKEVRFKTDVANAIDSVAKEVNKLDNETRFCDNADFSSRALWEYSKMRGTNLKYGQEPDADIFSRIMKHGRLAVLYQMEVKEAVHKSFIFRVMMVQDALNLGMRPINTKKHLVHLVEKELECADRMMTERRQDILNYSPFHFLVKLVYNQLKLKLLRYHYVNTREAHEEAAKAFFVLRSELMTLPEKERIEMQQAHGMDTTMVVPAVNAICDKLDKHILKLNHVNICLSSIIVCLLLVIYKLHYGIVLFERPYDYAYMYVVSLGTVFVVLTLGITFVMLQNKLFCYMNVIA